MKKQTTRQRIEQAVNQYVQDGAGFINIVDPMDAVKLILAERRRIRREVRKMRDEATVSKFVGSRDAATYRNACDDMLARLRG